MDQNDVTRLQQEPEDVTRLAPAVLSDAAEAVVPFEWNVGDIILDRYEVKYVLGEGGMGKVYLIRHLGWGIDLAVKSPRPEHFRTEAHKENFVREAETWVNLGLHPHTVSCYYVRTLGGIPRIFAEYVEGGSLTDWIAERRLYEGGQEKALERLLDIAVQFAWGLHYAHEQGLVHQDVKPGNVMMSPDGIVKVTDFGLAKARAAAGEAVGGGEGRSILVSSGGMTPAYCSPEQAAGNPLDRKTDVWSWGVSILEMFVGEVTWMTGQAAAEALAGYLETGTEDENIPAMPPGMAKLLGQCFMEESEERPANMKDIVVVLQRVYEQEVGQSYRRKVPKEIDLKADALNNRGVSYLDLNREEEAIACWEEALQENPHHLEAVFNSGYLKWQTAAISGDEYVTQMQELESSKGSDPDYWRCLGWIHLERGDLEAVENIQQLDNWVEDKVLKRALEDKNRPVGRLLTIIEGHEESVTSVCFSPDGRYVLSGSRDKTVRLWEVESGREAGRFEGHTHGVGAVCFSPDGRYALSGSGDKTIRLWEVKSRREVRRFEGHPAWVNCVCFSLDGRYALSGGEFDKTVRLWEVESGREVRRFEGHTHDISAVCFSPDGRYALSGGSFDKTIRLWKVESGREVRRFEGHSAWVYCVCFSPDGRYALSGGEDRTVRLWDVESGRELRRFQKGTQVGSLRISVVDGVRLPAEGWDFDGEVISVCFSPDGRHALSGGKDRIVRLWEVESGRELRRFRGHTGTISSVCFSPDGRYALSGGYDNPRMHWRDKTIRLWEVYYPARRRGEGHPFPFLCKVKAVARMGMERDQVKGLLKYATDYVEESSFHQAYHALREAQSVPGYERDREVLGLLAFCGIEGKGKRMGLKGSWFLHTYKGHTAGVTSVCFSPDGRYALSGGDRFDEKNIRLWEVVSGKELGRFEGHKEPQAPIPPSVSSICFSPDGRHVLSGGSDKTVRLWEVESGREVRRFEGHNGPVRSVCFSPDGRYALSGSGDGSVRLWEMTSESDPLRFSSYTKGVNSVCFSSDGQYILSGNDDKNVWLWEVTSRRAVGRYEGHTSPVRSVSFSPDSLYVLSSGYDKSVRLWETASGKEQRRFEGHQGPVNSVCFSPHGRYVLSASWDKTIRLWGVASGKELERLEGHTHDVSDVCFSPDGRYALSGSKDNSIRLWEFDWEWEFKEESG